MRKLIVLAMAVPLFVWVVNADGQDRTRNSTVTMNNDNPNSDDCRNHMRVGNDGYRSTVRDEEAKTLGNQPLTITASRNGGVQVITWDKPEFALKLCKQIAVDDENQGHRILAETKLEVSGATVTVRTPDEGDYSLGTLLLVSAPKDASVSVSVHNGGVSFNRFTGTADAHADNGGISFKQSSGKLTAKAQNGGISITDCGGDVNATVQNGGLSLTLPERWEGKGLDAHAHNGGLSVSVPKNFNGGLEITASEHTSIVCKDAICNDGQKTWDGDHKTFRLGGTNPQIRASTENGGIVISERGHTREMF